MDPQVCSLRARAVIQNLIHCFPFRTYSVNYSVAAGSLVVVAAHETRGHARARTSFTVYTSLWRTCIRARRPS